MWMMTQAWADLLFLHWPADPEKVRPHIPAELELDLYDDKAWIGIVPFAARGTRPRFLPPIPGTVNFLELNVRTYVRYKEKSGVYFFSLDANSRAAVAAASFGGFLPYRRAAMALKKGNGNVQFKSRLIEKGAPEEKLSLRYRISEEQAGPTNLEKWLTERYCLWTKPGRQLLRLDIAHDPWQLHYVKGEITANTMAPYLGVDFRSEKAMAHYGGMKNVRFFPPVIEK